MSNPSPRPVALLVGADRPFAADIEARLKADGFDVLSLKENSAAMLTGTERLAAGVVIAPMKVSGSSFLTLTDEAFVERVEDFLDLTFILQTILARLQENGALVVLTSRGYLGAWGGVDEMIYSAATVGLMRSISLENTPRGVRANVVALDFPPEDFGGDTRRSPDHGTRVAGCVSFLVGVDAAAVNGEVILCNAGRSLQRREARDRREELNRIELSAWEAKHMPIT